jgi:hypothetical protein
VLQNLIEQYPVERFVRKRKSIDEDVIFGFVRVYLTSLGLGNAVWIGINPCGPLGTIIDQRLRVTAVGTAAVEPDP